MHLHDALSRRGTCNISPVNLAAGLVYAADRLLALQDGKKRVLTCAILSAACGIPDRSINDVYRLYLKPVVIPIANRVESIDSRGNQ